VIKRSAIFALAVLLASCGGPVLPYSKDQPADNTAVKPPWEALVKAGPGAENDLDLNTLNGPGVQPLEPAPPPPEELRPAAEPGSDDVAVVAPEQGEKPKAAETPKKKGVVIKAVALTTVTGAPGKGNAELASAMRDVLKQAGWPVLTAKREDALTITGKVGLAAASGGAQKVRIAWVVMSPDGKVLGDVVQENDVPAGSLDAGFGEDARFVAEAAATGVFDLIQKFR
jgi:hypothetical protein